MRDEDKPFVCYRKGWAMQIVPRNAAGWQALAAWLISLAPLVGIFVFAMESVEGTSAKIGAVVAFIAVTSIWALLMIRWMLVRSEIVDLAEVYRLRAKRGRRGTRTGGRKS